MKMTDKKIVTGILAAIGASLCCITPVLAVLAGSAGMASTFSWMEPFRPYLIGLTILVLAYAWWDKFKPVQQGIACACEDNENEKVSFWYTKTFLAIVTVFAAVMLSFPYWGHIFIQSNKEKVILAEKANIVKKIINIEGMTCQACEATVAKAGGDVDGVIKIIASTPAKHAIVEYDQSKTTIEAIMKAIAKTGYKPTGYEDEGDHHDIQSNQ
jgi:copper chaperone CopZ